MNIERDLEDIIERYQSRRKLRNSINKYKARKIGRIKSRNELDRADERWITVGAKEPNKRTGDPGHKGKHVLINEAGEVVAGAGGSLTGVKLTKAKSTSEEVKADPKKVASPKTEPTVETKTVGEPKTAGEKKKAEPIDLTPAVKATTEEERVAKYADFLKGLDVGSKITVEAKGKDPMVYEKIGEDQYQQNDAWTAKYGAFSARNAKGAAEHIDFNFSSEAHPGTRITVTDKDGNETVVYDKEAAKLKAREGYKKWAAKIGKAKTKYEAEILLLSIGANLDTYTPAEASYIYDSCPIKEFSLLGDRCVSVANTLKSLDDQFGLIEEYEASVGAFPPKYSYLGVCKSFFKDTKKGVGVGLGFTTKFSVADLITKQREMCTEINPLAKHKETPFKMPCKNDDETYLAYTPTHEYGHLISQVLMKKDLDKWSKDGTLKDTHYSFTAGAFVETPRTNGDWSHRDSAEWMKNAEKEIMQYAKQHDKKATKKWMMSGYGKSDADEFFAEAFANAMLGKPNAIGLGMIDYLKAKGMGKWS